MARKRSLSWASRARRLARTCRILRHHQDFVEEAVDRRLQTRPDASAPRCSRPSRPGAPLSALAASSAAASSRSASSSRRAGSMREPSTAPPSSACLRRMLPTRLLAAARLAACGRPAKVDHGTQAPVEIDQAGRRHRRHRLERVAADALLGVVAAQALEHEGVQLRLQRGAALAGIAGAAACPLAGLSARPPARRRATARSASAKAACKIDVQAALDQGARQAQRGAAQGERILVAGGLHARRRKCRPGCPGARPRPAPAPTAARRWHRRHAAAGRTRPARRPRPRSRRARAA